MAYRILSAALIVCLAGFGAAQADVPSVRPECLDKTTIDQMNLEQLQECQKEIQAVFSRSPLFIHLAEEKCIDEYTHGRVQPPGCIIVMKGGRITATVRPSR
jgi:hypothetical protein